MLPFIHRGSRAALKLGAGVLLSAALLGAACSDDGAEQADTSEQAQGAAQQAQTQAIDASQEAQQSAAESQTSQEDATEEPAAPQEDAEQQEAPAEAQDEPADDPADDPDRDTLIEGERFASSISAGQTERQFRFEAAAGSWLRIEVDGKGGMDPITTLLGPDGVEIAVNDDQSNTNRDSLIIAQVAADGLQYIRVQPYAEANIGDFVIQVQVWNVGPDNDDAVIRVGDSVDGRLNLPDDVDVFDFEVEAGEQVFVLIDGDTGVDVYGQVFQPDGNLLQIDDDGGHGLDSEMYFIAGSTGTWRVEVWPAANKDGVRQLIGSYRLYVRAGLPTSAVTEAVASDLAGAALTFLQALRDEDTATLLALAGPEALTTWGWDDTSDIDRDLAKLTTIDLGGEILQSVAFGDVINSARGRVYFQFDETDWMRFELIQLAGHWLVDDWAHSVGPPS